MGSKTGITEVRASQFVVDYVSLRHSTSKNPFFSIMF